MLSLIICSAMLPILIGVVSYGFKLNKKINNALAISSIAISLIINIIIAIIGNIDAITVLKITDAIQLVAKSDVVSNFFSILFNLIFLIVSVFSLKYFEHDENKNKFDCFYLLSLGALNLLSYSGNIITMYISFEMVTLFSMPTVLHEKTKESIDAAMKYLIYSIGGAFLGLIGVVFISIYNVTPVFTLGGTINSTIPNEALFQVVILLMLIGFGAKCGMFPLHNWLPSAHPVAPAPASAVLSGIITKSGVLAIIRIIYYSVGAEYIRNTWVQYTWVILILITILLGSFMAAIQKNFKKRLAFSSVSQISYVLLGLSMLNSDAFAGSFLHVASHAAIKVCLFLVAGALIHELHIHDVDELEGVGKKMPITMWCYTIASLGLIGVPPTGGFVSKWYLATGSINSGLVALNIIAPICLIISAILTAYYLLNPTISAFFPKNKEVTYEKMKEPLLMVIPLIILATLVVCIGIFAAPIAELIGGIL